MPAIVASIVGWLISALRQWLPGIVGRVMLALGIGLATHQIVVPSLLALVQARVAALPPSLVAYFGALDVEIVVTMILSAAASHKAQKVVLRKLGG